MISNKFAEAWLKVRNLIHYDLPDSNYYPSHNVGFIVREALNTLFLVNCSLFMWCAFYELWYRGFYQFSISVLLIGYFLKIKNSLLLIGLLGLLPVLYVDFTAIPLKDLLSGYFSQFGF